MVESRMIETADLFDEEYNRTEFSNITHLELPEGTKVICDGAFYRCGFEGYRGLTYIGEKAFAYCSELEGALLI